MSLSGAPIGSTPLDADSPPNVAAVGDLVLTVTAAAGAATAVLTFSAPAATVAPTVGIAADTALLTFSAPAAVVSVTVPAGTARADFSAPAATLTPGTAVLGAAAPVATFSAPSATLTPGPATLAPDAALVTFTAPAPVLAVSIPAVSVSATFTAPGAEAFTAGGLTSGTALATFTAPSADLAPGAVGLDVATATVTFSAPEAVTGTGFSIEASAAELILSAPSATIDASFTIAATTATATLSAPAATLAFGGISETATTATIVFEAPTATLDDGTIIVPEPRRPGWRGKVRRRGPRTYPVQTVGPWYLVSAGLKASLVPGPPARVFDVGPVEMRYQVRWALSAAAQLPPAVFPTQVLELRLALTGTIEAFVIWTDGDDLDVLHLLGEL